MSEIVYRISSKKELYHAYKSPYATSSRYNPKSRSNRYVRDTPLLKKREDAAKTGNPYGNYKSPYYDPVARHERYMRERASLGIGKGLGVASSGKGSKGGGSGRKGSKSSKGSKRGNGANISKAIAKLREESALDTEAHREATRRKIEDLRKQLKEHMDTLSGQNADAEEGFNVAEIRGKIQSIREEIERAGGDLNEWITNERDALERRIASIYASNGKKYTPSTQKDKQNAVKARDKEVKSRADSIYKSKSEK